MAHKVLREIQNHGFRGQRSIVRAFLTTVRQTQGLSPRSHPSADGPAAVDPTARSPTLRTVTWRILARPERWDDADEQIIVRVCQAHPDLETTITLARECAVMVRERQATAFDDWFARADASGIPTRQRFAASLRHDDAAVKAALDLPYSNGPTEGNINRLKMLKRQMYGRAKLDLLTQRVLAA